MPTLVFTAKEIHCMVQLIRLHTEEGEVFEYATKRELETLRTKLQNVKD